MGTDPRPGGLQVIGHRGAAGLAPENTLAGFRVAARLGCDGVECDVRAVEGRLAVLHDPTVDRTTDGRGTLDALGAEGLRRLDAGGGPVPWVEELLPLMVEYGDLLWNLELKDTAAAPLLLRMVEGWPHEVVSRLLVSSFVPVALEPWRGRGVALALCVDPLERGAVRCALDLGCGSIHGELETLRAPEVLRAREAGLAVRVFTVNEPDTARRLAAWGVCGVFTDRPDRLLDGPPVQATAGPAQDVRGFRSR